MLIAACSVAAALVIVLIVVAAVFGLRIVSSIAPHFAVQSANRTIDGTVSVERVSLSWRGPQVVEGVRLRAPDGELVADLSITATTGVWPILRGSRDFGELRLSGEVTIDRPSTAQDTNAELALAPRHPGYGTGLGPDGLASRRAGAPPSPSRLPETLAGAFVLDGLTVNYRDRDPAPGAPASVRVHDVRGRAAFRVGHPAVLELRAGVDVDGQAGHVEIDAAIDNLTQPGGLLSPDLANVRARVVADAPATLLATIPEVAAYFDTASLIAPDAERLRFALDANGDAGAVEIAVSAGAPGFSLDAALVGRADPLWRFSLKEPATAHATITPGVAQRLGLGDADLALRSNTVATLRIDVLEAPMLVQGGRIDLRGAAVRAVLETTEIHATAPGIDGAGRADVVIAPLQASLETLDLNGPIALRASTSATYDGRPAGTLFIDMTAQGVLDEDGAPRPGPPPRMQGEASLRGLAATIAQPFLAPLGLDSATYIGPSIDVVVVANAALTSVDAPSVLPSGVSVEISSANIAGRGRFTVDEQDVRSTDDGVVIEVQRAGPALARMLRERGVRIEGDAPVRVRLDDVVVRLPRAGETFNMADVGAQARLDVGGPIDVWAPDAATPVRIDGAQLSATVAPGSAPSALARAQGSYERERFTVQADAQAPGSTGAEALRRLGDGELPRAVVRIEDAPLALLALAGLEAHLPLARLAVGEHATVEFNAQPGEGATTALTLSLRAASLTADAGATLSPEMFTLTEATATSTLTPGLAAAVLAAYAPDLEPRPVLASAVDATVRVGRVDVPMTAWTPDLARASRASFVLDAPGAIVVRNAFAYEGRPVDAELRGLHAEGVYALAPGAAHDVIVTAAAYLPGRPDAALAGVRIEAVFDADYTPASALVRLTDVDAPGVDALLGAPDLLALSLGTPFDADVTLTPGALDGSQPLTARISAPRFTTEATLLVSDDAVTLTRPLDARWTMDSRWASRYLTPPPEDGEPRVVFTAPTDVTLRIERLALGRGDAPFLPGVFDAAATLTTGATALRTARGETIDITHSDARILAGASAEGRARIELGFVGRTTSPGAPGAPGAPTRQGFAPARAAPGAAQAPTTADARSEVRATVTGFADSAGAPTFVNAVVDLDATGHFPSELLDTMTRSEGRLSELLGPDVAAVIEARALSRDGGSLRARAESSRTDGSLRGRVQDGVFVSEEPVRASVHEMSPSLSAMTFEYLVPLFTNLEKTREDGPATLAVDNLRWPVRNTIDTTGDGVPDALDMRLFDADMRLELGRVRFQTRPLLGRLLQRTGNRPDGSLLDSFPVINVRVREGVATYQRTRIPVGEFSIETRGEVDLHRERMDIVVYVPLFALVDEVAGVFGRVPGLDRASLVPLRLRGPFGDVTPQPAPDLLLQELGVELPRRIVDELIGPAIDDLLRGGRRRDR
ncbi:MAG: hypothetical protein EA379_06830 [Phycisphaerales bacterium]|nr:MAG: hypothetical protein EA379_06830 [Phycisphaerales bacterium]